MSLRTGLLGPVVLILLAVRAAAAATAAATPVLVELFTAEGCSSCPPADAFLRQLDSTQPIAGTQLIVLSEHVNYWDHGGWPDPFASAALTDRQRAYAHALGLSNVYTPQFIVDGATEMRLSNRQKVADILEHAAAAAKVPVSVSALTVGAGAASDLSGQVDVDARDEVHRTDVYVGLALDRIESQVLRGENRGQSLTHVAVLRELVRLGALEPRQQFSQHFRIPLKDGMGATNVRVIVFVQESGYGKVVGASLQRPADDRG